MKKFSPSYICSWLGIEAFLGFGLSLFIFRKATLLSQILIGLILSILLILISCSFIFVPISKSFVHKTIKRLRVSDFRIDASFDSSNCTFFIDLQRGQIAAVTLFNPFEIQVIDAKNITHIRVSYLPEPLGKTTQTYFSFRIYHNFYKISTFISDRPLPLNSSKIIAGMQKAQDYVSLLQSAQKTSKLIS